MSNRAWVTLATNDSYGLGALVLAHSLRKAGSTYPVVVLITPSVTEAMRERLRAVLADVITVDVLDSKDAAHLALLQRPELGITFTKIHCWSLTQYEKCVFLDADTLVVQNCDELFDREEFSAAPDVGWPDCFNSGVFVYSPSQETFEKLIKFAKERGSFDGGDQGLLNAFFSDWAHGDINKHLPFLYNVTSAAFYSYLPALKHYGQNMKIIHFIGALKPWLQQYNWDSRTVDAPDHLRELLQQWWDLFVSQVHSQLDTTMDEVDEDPPAIAPQDVHDNCYYAPTIDPQSEFPWHHPKAQEENTRDEPEIDMSQHYDPWDSYVAKPAEIHHYDYGQTEHKEQESNDHDQWHYHLHHHHHEHHNEHHQEHHQEHQWHHQHNYSHDHSVSYHQQSSDSQYDHQHGQQNTPIHHKDSSHSHEHNSSTSHLHFEPSPKHKNKVKRTYYHIHLDHRSSRKKRTNRVNSVTINGNISDESDYDDFIPRHPYDGFYLRHKVTVDPRGRKICTHEIPPTPSSSPSSPLEYSNPDSLTSLEDENAPSVDGLDQTGVAGNLARVVPGSTGVPREAIDELTRRQGWEAGNIDYMGADAFENIWAKISETLNQPRVSPPKEAPKEATPPPKQPSPPKEAPVAKPVQNDAPVVSTVTESKPAPVESKPEEPIVPATVESAPKEAEIVPTPAVEAAEDVTKEEQLQEPVEPASKVEPSKVEEAPKEEQPQKPVEPASKVEPAKVEEAPKVEQPQKPVEPASKVEPAKVEEAPKVEQPQKPVEPASKVEPAKVQEAPKEEPKQKTEVPPTPPASPKSEPSTPVAEVPKPVQEPSKATAAPVEAATSPTKPEESSKPQATPEKPAEKTSADSPPLANTPSKEDAPSVPAAKLEERRKPAGKLQLNPPVAPDPLPTPDSELEDAATLAHAIIASELATPTVTSPSPPVVTSPQPPLQEKRLSVDETQLPTPPIGNVSLAQIGVKPKTKASTAAQIESSVSESPDASASAEPKKKVVKKVVKKDATGAEAPVPPPRKKEKKPKDK